MKRKKIIKQYEKSKHFHDHRYCSNFRHALLAIFVTLTLLVPSISLGDLFYPVKDINTTPDPYQGPGNLVDIGGVLYFTMTDGVNGYELWKLDGTEAGAVMVADIWPGFGSSGIGGWGESVVEVNGTLFFSADDGVNGDELWKTDGTEAGTVMVKDINPGPDGSGTYVGSGPSDLHEFNGILFFVASAGGYGSELWKSDGTEAGTVMVKDIRPGSGGSQNFSHPEMANMNGALFFTAYDGDYWGLWMTDGTEAGTVKVKPSGLYASNLTTVSETLYFTGDDYGMYGRELWKSDGSDAGTVLVKDINPGTEDSSPRGMTHVSGTLFFSADDGVNGDELWKTDGTEAGTVLVKDIRPGSSGGGPDNLIDVNGTLFFVANDGVNGRELWTSDGTEAGTFMVKDINTGSGDSLNPIRPMSAMNGILYFYADDGVNGRELWSTDGTEAGTVMVKDINPGTEGSLKNTITGSPHYPYLTDVSGTLFFVADDGVNGRELWMTDGTEAGTVMFGSSSSPCSMSSDPKNLKAVSETLYFTADGGMYGEELWKSDGSEAGTVMVKDINPGAEGSSGQGRYPYLTDVSGTPFFVADDGVNGRELWRSDGTETGTVMVKDINLVSGRYGPGSSSPRFLTAVNGILFFSADDGVNGKELWMSDGTEAGTVMVKDIKPGSGYNSSSPESLIDFNGTLFFRADDGVNGKELWISDGTEAGTHMVKDIQPGSGSSSPGSLINFNGALFFNAADGVNGSELWMSDGTEAGTVMFKDIRPGADGSGPSSLTDVNGTLFFKANNGVNGSELWMSDGTEAGTVMVKDIKPGDQSTSLDFLTGVSGTLFLRVNDGIHGLELWKSDGTEAGTVMVKDIKPGSESSLSTSYSGMNWTGFNGVLYFVANATGYGLELWRSDGTEAGTTMADIKPGSSGSYPRYLTAVNGSLFFSADNGCIGDELFSVLFIPISPYDTNEDWVIGDFELLNAIDEWAAGSLGDFELLDLIDSWAAGCYRWDDASGSYKPGC